MTQNTYSDAIDKLYLFKDAKSGKWKYRRRIPEEVRHLDPRREIKKSTKKSDYAEAVVVAREINAATEQYWIDLLDGKAATAADRAYDDAVKRARRLGFSYRTAENMIADRDAREVVERLAELLATGQIKSPLSIDAVLGVVDTPDISLSQLAERYFAISQDKQLHQRPDTNRRWKQQHIRAVEKAVSAIGDKSLASINASDVLDFREWLISEVAEDNFKAAYANKCLGNLVTMWREVNVKHRLGLQPVFADMKLSNAKDGKRAAYDPGFVASTLLGPTTLAGLSLEARAVVALCASTGMRPIEFARMPPENIVLDHKIPHLRIAAADDSAKAAAEAGLKVAHTARLMPLCGSALAAVRAFPNGLVDYKGKSQALTSTIGKYLRENGLCPTERHSLYSLRHTFKDRLRAAGCPDEIKNVLMGHKADTPDYGDGYPLDMLAEWVERVAFDAPEWL